MQEDRLGLGKVMFPQDTDNDLLVALDDFATKTDDNLTYILEGNVPLLDYSVTTEKISDDAITAQKIASKTITSNEIAALAITAAEIANSTITNLQIAANSITGANIASGTITAINVAANAITSDKIEASSITGQKIAADAIDSSHISANTIDADMIQSDAITSSKIKAASVTSDKINAGAVTADKISVTSLDALSANLGEMTSGLITASTVRTSPNPTVNRVIMDAGGLRGYDSALGIVFNIPTDGTPPTFSSGLIQNATIINTTIVSNDYRNSDTLPWLEFNDAGLAYRTSGSGGLYGTAKYGTDTYGAGVTGYVFNASYPLFAALQEKPLADIRLYNRASNPTGAAEVGDLCCVLGKLKICTTAGTPGTWTIVGSQS